MIAQLEQSSELGAKIRTARLHNGFSQQRLADKLGAHVVMIQRWEAGRNVPQLQYRRKLWDLLGLTPDDFDPPPTGSHSQEAPAGNVEGFANGEQPTTWGELISAAVNSFQANIPLSQRLELERTLQDGLRNLENQDADLASRIRGDLIDPNHQTMRFFMSVAFAFSSYLANRHNATATADLETTINQLDLSAA